MSKVSGYQWTHLKTSGKESPGLMEWIIVIAVFYLAFFNGANDNFKGVATLYGSGTLTYNSALKLTTLATFFGSICAFFLASTLMKNFSGKGLVPMQILQNPEFIMAVALGAAFTLFAATRFGIPISTTHSLVGSLTGAGVMAAGSQLAISKLYHVFLFPLLISPIVAALMTLVLYPILSALRKLMGITKTSLLQVSQTTKPQLVTQENLKLNNPLEEELNTLPTLHLKSTTDSIYQGALFGISLQTLLNAAHIASAFMVCFARGLNDTPKILGLLIVLQIMDPSIGLWGIAVAMGFGGWLLSHKLAHTMAHKITEMNDGQGLTANLTTSLLVTTASLHGMPVSTTHVSCGSLFGLGASTGKAHWKTITGIFGAWVFTLPLAAFLAAFLFWLQSIF